MMRRIGAGVLLALGCALAGCGADGEPTRPPLMEDAPVVVAPVGIERATVAAA